MTAQSYDRLPQSYLQPRFKATATAVPLQLFSLMTNHRNAAEASTTTYLPLSIPQGSWSHSLDFQLDFLKTSSPPTHTHTGKCPCQAHVSSLY